MALKDVLSKIKSKFNQPFQAPGSNLPTPEIVTKAKKAFTEAGNYIASKTPLGQTVQGLKQGEAPKDILHNLKSDLSGTTLDFPTTKDWETFYSKTASKDEKMKVLDKAIASASIFGVGGLEAEGQIVKKVATTAIEEIKQNPAVLKLVNAIKEAKPAQKELATLQSAERGARAGEVAGVLKQGEGEKGYIQALGKLKGELVEKRPAFEGLRGENKLAQEDIDSLFKGIQQHPVLDVYEKINAQSGLSKILSGEIPQKSELSLLEDVYGGDLIKGILEKRTGLQKFGDNFKDLINVPRSMMASFDFSAPLRQGILFTTTKPRQAIPALGSMFKQAFSQKNFDEYILSVKQSPEYKLMKDSGLYISDPNKISNKLSSREESFMSNIAERIPGIGGLIKGSGRAYSGFLNKMRVDVFNDLSKNFLENGLSPKEDAKVFKDLATFVNTATGRGNLGKLEKAGEVMNSLFFSPRLIASRFNMLNPVWYAKQSPQVRKEAIKTMAKFIGFGSTILTIAKAGGADVETDPRSTDFGKIRVGNTRWDIWGGFQQWVRIFSQIASGSKKTAKGDIIELSKEKFPYETRFDVGLKFLRGKLAPVPGLVGELLDGQTLFGEELKFSKKATELLVPLYLSGIKQTIDDIGPGAIFTAGIPSLFGVGVQTYEEKQKGLSDIWK